jgi:hypothetical protein
MKAVLRGWWRRETALGFIGLVVAVTLGFALVHPTAGPTALRSVATPSQPVTTPPALREPAIASGSGSERVEPFHLRAGTYSVSWTPQWSDEFVVYLDVGADRLSVLPQRQVSSGKLGFRVATDGDYTLEVMAPQSLQWSIRFTPV